MKKLLTLLALGCSLSLGVAHATTTPAQAAQQNKMKTCNADAKTQSLKGDARSAFMKTCLSGKASTESTAATSAPAAAKPAGAPVAATAKPAPAAVPATPVAAAAKPAAAAAPVPAAATSQQSKMTTCNADAKTKNLAGDARKQFMSSCLKG